jgi:hypothetical protein
MASKKTRGSVVAVDGERRYTLAAKDEAPADTAGPDWNEALSNEAPFLGHKDYQQHRKQTKKSWDWKEGEQSSFIQGEMEDRHEAYNRSLATDGRMVGGERANTFGHKLHKGTISRDEEGRSHFSLANPIRGFSENKITKTIYSPEPNLGKKVHEANTVNGGGYPKAVASRDITVHHGVHDYDQPKWL